MAEIVQIPKGPSRARLCLFAVVSPESVRRAYYTGRVSAETHERIRRAALELGLPPPRAREPAPQRKVG